MFDKLLGGNILYYPGCLTKFARKDIKRNYMNLLRKARIDFIMLEKEELCCGSPVLNAGYPEEYENLKERSISIFKEYGVKKIITGCPACYRMLKSYGTGIEIEHAATTIKKAIDSGRLKIKEKSKKEIITFHDPCHLGRYSQIYDEPRGALKKIYEIKEMKSIKDNSLCCGGGAGLPNNFSSIAKKVAKSRIKEAEETGAKRIVTPCPMCTEHLKNSSKKIEITEFSEAVINAVY